MEFKFDLIKGTEETKVKIDTIRAIQDQVEQKLCSKAFMGYQSFIWYSGNAIMRLGNAGTKGQRKQIFDDADASLNRLVKEFPSSKAIEMLRKEREVAKKYTK